MSKKSDYQLFSVRMRNITNRPVFLLSMFERGLTVEEATTEMARFKANGANMFKASTLTRGDRPTRKDRVMTLELMQRAALRGAYQALRSAHYRRMTGEAREWRETQLTTILERLNREESE